MNNGLQPVSSNFSGAPYLSNAWLKTTQIADHAITYIQGIPAEMNRSTIATITVIALANAVIIYAANYLANRIDSRYDFKTNPTIPKERTVKHICAREFLTASAVFAVNMVLAVAAKVQLNEVTIGLFGAAAALVVAIRYFQNREKRVTPPIEEEKTNVGVLVQEWKIKAENAENEKKRADALETVKSDLDVRVKALNLENDRLTKELAAAKDSLKDKAKATEKEISDLKGTIATLQKEKDGVEAARKQAADRIRTLETEIRQANEAKKVAESSADIIKEEMIQLKKATREQVDTSTLARSTAQKEKADIQDQLTQFQLSAKRKSEEDQQKITQLEQAIRRTEGELTAAKKTIDQNKSGAEARIGELSGQIAKYEETISKSTKEIQRLKQTLAESEQATDSLESRCDALRKTNKVLSEENELLNGEIKELNKQLDLRIKLLAEAKGVKEDPIDKIEEAEGLNFTVVNKEGAHRSNNSASAASPPNRRVIQLNEEELTASAKKRQEDFRSKNARRKK